MNPVDTDGLGLSARVRLVNLSEVKAEEVLNGVEAGAIARAVLSMLPLMDGGDRRENIARWATLASQEPDEQRRGDLGGLAETLAEAAGRSREWQEVLEGWNVERSTFLMERENKAIQRHTRTNLVKLLERRLKQAIPEDLLAVIDAQKDTATLDAWLLDASTASTLEEVRAFLG